MRLPTNLSAALVSLWEQRRRTSLSAVGVTVASIAIVLLVSIARGVQHDVGRQVEGLGVNLLVVLPGRIDDTGMFSPNLAGLSYLDDSDVDRVRQLDGVRRATPFMFVGGGLSAGDKSSRSTFLVAADPEWFTIRPTQFAEGAPFGPGDERVCVIGSIAKQNLFGHQPAVGRFIEVNGVRYRVVGVTVEQEAQDSLFAMGGFANVAYLPYATAREVVPNPQIHRIMIQTAPDREPKALVASVERTLAERLEPEMFSVLTQRDLLRLVFKVMSILTYLLVGLTSIALVVGGVGIMTVMLMSVNERAKEIGIRKTAGARTADIFAQFLIESAAVSALGGLVGLGISAVVCVILAATTDLKPLLTADVVALSLGVCLGVGTVFGLWPAMRAARSDPVAALRSD